LDDWDNPMPTTPDRIAFRLERKVAAPIADVFRAFSDPREFEKWCWGSIGRDVKAEIDFRKGGRLSASTDTRDRKRWTFAGAYGDVQPNRRIVHTLSWDAPMGYDDADEVVTIEFTPRDDGGTTILFRHEGNFSAAARDEHGRGWTNVFNTLEKHLAGQQAVR